MLERPVQAELPEHVYWDDKRQSNVMILIRSLYGLKDAGRIWIELAACKLEEPGLKELERALCMFRKKNVLVACYVYDLLVFVEKLPQI